ncbi:MAG: hypothetical protein M1816_002601 [Peltula sp. TS41687]|nr:MAG: hypothetical protein M1816_002601 [Peltula sp. TS41687]
MVLSIVGSRPIQPQMVFDDFDEHSTVFGYSTLQEAEAVKEAIQASSTYIEVAMRIRKIQYAVTLHPSSTPGRPWGLVDFLQQSGRAGREGQAAQSLTLLSRSQLSTFRAGDDIEAKDQQAPTAYLSTTTCRRHVLSTLMDDDQDAPACAFGQLLCDNCRGRTITKDNPGRDGGRTRLHAIHPEDPLSIRRTSEQPSDPNTFSTAYLPPQTVTSDSASFPVPSSSPPWLPAFVHPRPISTTQTAPTSSNDPLSSSQDRSRTSLIRLMESARSRCSFCILAHPTTHSFSACHHFSLHKFFYLDVKHALRQGTEFTSVILPAESRASA